jgi:hypothetical protein|tara:strand:+ start:2067 stop:2486 length:420 start_codon:yes stop_codon:yes gene_type:complete
MIGTDTIAYIAGLFDGEGHIQYKQYVDTKRKNRPKRYKVWRIAMEMSMTDEPVIRWVHEVLGVGTVTLNVKNKSPSSKPHWKDQWRWRCSHRDALYVCKLIWPYAQVKLHKVEQIIDHYDAAKPDQKNIVNLNQYRKVK